MTRYLLMAMVAVLAVAAFAVPAQATCTQGGIPLCGLCTSYDLIYDGSFSQSSCNAWTYGPNAQKATSGTMCSGWGAPFGQFYGSMSGVSYIRQTTTALTNHGDHFWLDYTVDITDSTNNSNTWIAAYIYQPNGTWLTVDTPAGGARWCDSRSIDLGHHSDWVGQNLIVEFDAYTPVSGATIDITLISLWQDQ